MRALSFLFAALLGIALAMIAPVLAGAGTTASGTADAALEPITAEVADLAQVDGAAELEDSLIVDLGLDPLEAPILDGLRFGDAA